MKHQIDNFKKKIYNPTPEDLKKASYSFALFSANIKKFLPEINPEKYREMYQEVLCYQKTSGLEQSNTDYLKKCKITNHSLIDIDDLSVSIPTFFTTFHLGSYRLLNCFLFQKGHKVVLLIDESVFMSQQEEMLRVCNEVLNKKETSDMIILNVKDRSSIFKLKQLIEQGYVVSVYLDGNTGVHDKNQDFSKSYIPIQFLNNTIYVKNGIGKLAALLEAQLIPVVSYRENNDFNHLEFHKELKLNNFKDKQEYSVKSIEIAYTKLEEKLALYPTQWECWLYIHKWFLRNRQTSYFESSKLAGLLNTERYTTYVLGESPFLFDMLDYTSFPIDKNLFDALNNNNFNEITPQFRQELILKNIII